MHDVVLLAVVDLLRCIVIEAPYLQESVISCLVSRCMDVADSCTSTMPLQEQQQQQQQQQQRKQIAMVAKGSIYSHRRQTLYPPPSEISIASQQFDLPELGCSFDSSSHANTQQLSRGHDDVENTQTNNNQYNNVSNSSKLNTREGSSSSSVRVMRRVGQKIHSTLLRTQQQYDDVELDVANTAVFLLTNIVCLDGLHDVVGSTVLSALMMRCSWDQSHQQRSSLPPMSILHKYVCIYVSMYVCIYVCMHMMMNNYCIDDDALMT